MNNNNVEQISKTMKTRVNEHGQSNYSRSLKAILKQTRIPLSHYINHKPSQVKCQHTSYFQKLKGMLKHSELYRNSFTPIVNQHITDTSKRSKSINNQISIEKSIEKTIIKQLQSQSQNKITTISYKKQMKKQIINYNKYQIISGHKTSLKIQLTHLLGSGANATVRLAQQIQSNNKYAVKIYDKYKLIDQTKKKRVYKQIKLLSRLNHENIVKLHFAYEDKRQIHLLFQFIQKGQTLQDHFRNNLLSLSQHEIKRILKGIAKGMLYLHQMGVAHRDIKPQNILVTQNHVKVIDFGFATSQQSSQIHCGTPNFMAPQLYLKNRIYCPFKVDIWAYGVLAYYLYQSAFPFRGFNQKNLAQNIRKGCFVLKKTPNNLAYIINGALSIDPQSRITFEQILQLLS